MLDILTTQTSSQQTGKAAQNKKTDTSDAKNQAFAEEYAATGDDLERTGQQQADDAQAASQDQQSGDETGAVEDTEASPENPSNPDTEASETAAADQPAFAIVDSGKAGKLPDSEATSPTAELSNAKRANTQDLVQAPPSDAAKLSESAGVTKKLAASAAEIFVTAKAAENVVLPTSERLTEQPAKGVRSDAQSMTAALVTRENTPVAGVNAPTSNDHVSEKLKSIKLSEELAARAVSSRSDTQGQQVTPAATNTPQAATMVPMTTLAKVDAGKEKTLLDSTSALNIEALSATESRGTSSTATTPLNQLLGRAETPAAIARQMAEALQKLPDRPVEISLNPKELGRVRMNISAVEAGITVTIVTERPETLDLMRRNIDQLVREFEAIGYNDINFAFSEGETQQSFGEGADERSSVQSTQLEILEAEDVAEANETKLHAQTGVDIRL